MLVFKTTGRPTIQITTDQKKRLGTRGYTHRWWWSKYSLGLL